MKATDFFQSKYLRKEDLSGPTVLTIAQVLGEMVDGDGGKEMKAVMKFTDGRYKPMIINKGNFLTMAESYGEDSDQWHGKQVELFVDPNVMFGGKRVGGLRLRMPSAGASYMAQRPVQTLEQVMVATGCAQVGVTRELIVEKLKKQGHTGFNSSRDTLTIEALVADAKAASDEQFSEMEYDNPEPSQTPF